MLKLEIELDANVIEELDYNSSGIFQKIPEIFATVGLILEKSDNGYFLFRGPGLNTDLAYIAMAVTSIKDSELLKKSCKKMLLLSDEDSADGSFYVDSDWVKSYKEFGMW